MSASEALAIGLISFCGVAQFMPSLVGGLFWRRASALGAFAGMAVGFLLWLYTLFLPSFGGSAIMTAEVIAQGPFGLEWLKPHALSAWQASTLWRTPCSEPLRQYRPFRDDLLITEPTPLHAIHSLHRRLPPADGERLRVIRRTAQVGDLSQMAEQVIGPRDAMGSSPMSQRWARRGGKR